MAGISQALQLFGDFGFSGGHDIAPDPLQNTQICINLYPEVNKQNAKEVLGLLGAPGLNQVAFAPGGGAPTETQTFSPNTILLMHFDGPNNSTNFIDSSPNNISFSVDSGSPIISTTQFEFGGASYQGNITSSNPSNPVGIIGHNSVLGIWDGDWTVELWTYFDYFGQPSQSSTFLSMGNSLPSGTNPFPSSGGGPHIDFIVDSGGQPIVYYQDNSGTNWAGGFIATVPRGSWGHLAYVRHNNVLRCYIGGVQQAANFTLPTSGWSSCVWAAVGGSRCPNAAPWVQGWMDELRISKSAIYTSSFTPPTAPFMAGTACRTVWPAVSAVTNLPVRGLWELPNDNTALSVIGNTCYLVKVATPPIGYPPAFPTLSLTSVGTLLTNTGPVSIRDNNAGGYAVIVDGPYGYLYNISSQAFTQITDPAFLGADTVAFIDGWWVFNQYSVNGSQTFYTNFPQYSTTFNGSYFALKDGAADNLRAVFENKEQLWLLGDKTTEIWYDAGGQYFAFQRLVGTMLQYGCKAAHSVARFYTEGQDGVIWFGRSERGENVILRSRGFTIDTVSTPAFSNEVSQYPIVNDAIGYTYQEDTHEFYMLIFPTADTTWCYDSQSGLLHKRLSYDPYLQQFHRHRSNCFMNFQGMRIVGDYQCGSLYQMTRNVFTDAGWPLLAKRRSPHVWDKGQRGRVFMASLQIDFQQGVGNPSCMGTDPQAGLAISRDGGKTFGQRWNAPIGKIGQYKNRTMWRKLAFGRDNVVDVEIIDPVKRDIIGVTLKAFSSA